MAKVINSSKVEIAEVIKDETHIDPQPQVEELPELTIFTDNKETADKLVISFGELKSMYLALYLRWYMVGQLCYDILLSWKENKSAYQKQWRAHNNGQKLLLKRPTDGSAPVDSEGNDIDAYFWDIMGLNSIGYQSALNYKKFYVNRAFFVNDDDENNVTVLDDAPEFTNVKDAIKYDGETSEDGETLAPKKAEYVTTHIFTDHDKITIRGYKVKPKTKEHDEKHIYTGENHILRRLTFGLLDQSNADNFVKAFNEVQVNQLINALNSRKAELIEEKKAEVNAKRAAKLAAKKTTTKKAASKRKSATQKAKEVAIADMANA